MKLRDAFSGKRAFVAYITAGDPSLEATAQYVEALVAGGADVIELGVPFSDPVADGPTNQKAAERALKNHVSLEKIFGLAKKLRERGIQVPLVLFTYLNPVFRMGFEKFATLARDSQVDGVLVVDLPPEEATQFKALMDKNGIATVFLASPTTHPNRLKLISDMSSGFVYYVSRTGVTGVQDHLSATLEDEVQRVRAVVQGPIGVGFGISTPDQAREVARISDGVVVGSALVKIIEANPDPKVASEKLRELTKTLVDGMRSKKAVSWQR